MQQIEPGRRRFGAFAAALLAGAVFVGATAAVSLSARAMPAAMDRSLDRLSDHGVFRVKVASTAQPIPMSQIHQWTTHLSGADGRPVSGAQIAVDGGMPDHGHGLPTAPRAAPAAGAGDYLISGMKFSMTGWWVLKLAISAPDDRKDTITFNLVL
jgi:hypothetical protein